ncbi:TonB-dependent receptor domain-containing protein [Nitrospira lenta]|uniref:Putative TonB-dependent receptor plug n=1 Tax=Nitrospira lenta TaxID=1436998 RepID=A0A330L163_9BACT|nr:TonB-dependent receptor [Nitrospira lenta]SPP63384.1 putative TonB-dependent receptor plug [Nitrospira lenta]
MTVVALLHAWPVQGGAADIRPLPNPLPADQERRSIAASSPAPAALSQATTAEQNRGESRSHMTERNDTAAARPSMETPSLEQGDTLMIAEVEVTGRREAVEFDPTRSRTTLTAKELERRQSDNVFTVLQDTPGVSVNGGPLASGMKFNIRGFSDSEDVLIKLDGAMRNFEKYRFGSGVFIEPELLKAIEVTRGPAGALQGSGAIGGVVEMRTKDAADLLAPGDRAGARIKSGWSSNNDEKLGSASVYGVVLDSIDLLANFTRRWSGDITTASGDPLKNTKSNRLSGLAKATYRPRPGASITFAETYSQESTLQPFDATIGIPGVFGFVRRAVTDSTPTANFEYTPASHTLAPWINLRGTLGHTSTSVTDSDRQNAKGVLIPNSPTNFFDYRILTLDLRNTSMLRINPVRNALTYGIQYNHNSRTTKTEQVSPVGRQTVDNLSQPSGLKSNLAFMVEDRLEIGDMTFTAGLRHDQYAVEVNAQETRTLLQTEGRSPRIEFAKTVPSAGIAWNMLGGPLTIFYNYAEAFRPPLVDELFTQGGFSRCQPLYFGALAPDSRVCGDRYRPETSRNHEVGLSLNYPRLFAGVDALTAKVVVYRNRVQHILESLAARTSSGVLCDPFNSLGQGNTVCTHLTQDGQEHREGIEFELGFRTEHWFSNLNLAAVRGKQVCEGERAMYDIPGNTLVFTLGRSDLGNRLEYGYRIRAVGPRRVITGSSAQIASPCNTGLTIGDQAGYLLHNLFAAYRPHQMLSLNLTLDNFTNTRYFLNDGFGGGIGQEAPGYNLRVFASLSF